MDRKIVEEGRTSKQIVAELRFQIKRKFPLYSVLYGELVFLFKPNGACGISIPSSMEPGLFDF